MSLAIEGKKPWKGRRKPQQHERGLHHAVADYLDLALPNDCFWYPIPNGANFDKFRGIVLKHTKQVKAGMPDIGLVLSSGKATGRAAFIELKTEANDTTEAQDMVGSQLTRAGAFVMVCRTVEQVRDFLEVLGVKLKPVRLT